jgi:hypothetical protein
MTTHPVHERLNRIAHQVWARGNEGAAGSIYACVTELEHRQGCACACCDHSEGVDCGCDCHSAGRCAFAPDPPAALASLPQEEP